MRHLRMCEAPEACVAPTYPSTERLRLKDTGQTWVSVRRGGACPPLPRPGGADFEQPGVATPGWQADNSPSPEGPAETSAVGRPFGARRIGFAHTWGCHPRLFKGRPSGAGEGWGGLPTWRSSAPSYTHLCLQPAGRQEVARRREPRGMKRFQRSQEPRQGRQEILEEHGSTAYALFSPRDPALSKKTCRP